MAFHEFQLRRVKEQESKNPKTRMLILTHLLTHFSISEQHWLASGAMSVHGKNWTSDGQQPCRYKYKDTVVGTGSQLHSRPLSPGGV